MIALARVVQKAKRPVVKLMKKRIAAASSTARAVSAQRAGANGSRTAGHTSDVRDRKSTRLNSSHSQISYAVFCLKKKNNRLETYRNLINGHEVVHQPHPSSPVL